jgi:chromate transport protein ChrA
MKIVIFVNILTIIISFYVIYNIVEMCKSQYYTMESFININNDKNWFIIIFRQIVFIITAMLLYVFIHNLHNNHPVKQTKYAKIVPI